MSWAPVPPVAMAPAARSKGDRDLAMSSPTRSPLAPLRETSRAVISQSPVTGCRTNWPVMAWLLTLRSIPAPRTTTDGLPDGLRLEASSGADGASRALTHFRKTM